MKPRSKKHLWFLPVVALTLLVGCIDGGIFDGIESSENETQANVTTTIVAEETDDETEASSNAPAPKPPTGKADISKVPGFSGRASKAINGNVPSFSDDDLVAVSYEEYSPLDSLGRCGVAVACIGKDLMPTENRRYIGEIKPTGWHTSKYDFVDGESLYNRCHLIGYQLTGENANERNLITGTRYMNTEGMLPFENMVADYIKETDNHVLYRVTPDFKGDNLVASGVLMEAESVEDKGEGIRFSVYCYNIQPGVTIDYATGDNKAGDSIATEPTTEVTTQETTTTQVTTKKPVVTQPTTKKPVVTQPATKKPVVTQPATKKPAVQAPAKKPATTQAPPRKPAPTQAPANQGGNQQMNYVLNTNTKRFHRPNCGDVLKIKDENKQQYTGTRDDLIAQGFKPCGHCHP